MPEIVDDKALFAPIAALRREWPQRGWSWDGRLQCVSSSFNAEIEPKTHAAAKLALPREWTSGTLGTAPPEVQQIASDTGGIRSGQIILAGPRVGGYFLYGLWWPWGDGTTTSLRVGVGGHRVGEHIYSRLRDAFDVSL